MHVVACPAPARRAGLRRPARRGGVRGATAGGRGRQHRAEGSTFLNLAGVADTDSCVFVAQQFGPAEMRDPRSLDAYLAATR